MTESRLLLMQPGRLGRMSFKDSSLLPGVVVSIPGPADSLDGSSHGSDRDHCTTGAASMHIHCHATDSSFTAQWASESVSASAPAPCS
jgi:hypothetical protein